MEQYFTSEGLSQSELKKYLSHPRWIGKEKVDELYYNEDLHLTKGSLLDLYVTQNDIAEEVFQKHYCLTEDFKISDKVKSIIHRIFDLTNEESLINVEREYVLFACDEHEYFLNRKKENIFDDKRYDLILNEEVHHTYWNFLRVSGGKILISQEEYDKILLMTNSILSNKFTSEYFNLDSVKFQVPLYDRYNCEDSIIKRKGLLDMVSIDEKNGIIYITDLKSSGQSLSSFISNIFRWRYDIQGDWYSDLLASSLDLHSEMKIVFQIIACSFVEPTYPEVFRFSPEILAEAKFGNPDKFKVGWQELLKRYIFHSKYSFEYSKDYIINGGYNLIK
jgi:hypothetical protein